MQTRPARRMRWRMVGMISVIRMIHMIRMVGMVSMVRVVHRAMSGRTMVARTRARARSSRESLNESSSNQP